MEWTTLTIYGDEVLCCNQCDKIITNAGDGGIEVFLETFKKPGQIRSAEGVICSDCYETEMKAGEK